LKRLAQEYKTKIGVNPLVRSFKVDEISEDIDDLGEERERDDQEYTTDRTLDIQKIEHIRNTLEELLREIKIIREGK